MLRATTTESSIEAPSAEFRVKMSVARKSRMTMEDVNSEGNVEIVLMMLS